MSTQPLIYVVDDNPTVCDSLCQLIRQSFEAEVVGLASGKTLLEEDIRLPDCLVLDLQLPDMSGMEVLKQLREQNKCIPTLVITGRSEELAARDAMPEFVQALLVKPCSSKRLTEKISQAITRD